MQIINNENYITNKQIQKIITKLGNEYAVNKIIICETRIDIFRNLLKPGIKFTTILSILFIEVWLGKIEGLYMDCFDTVHVFIFAQNEYKSKHSKQLYAIHALIHELRHKYQYNKRITKDEEKDADGFATKFVNSNSKFLAETMCWKNEWFVEEED